MNRESSSSPNDGLARLSDRFKASLLDKIGTDDLVNYGVRLIAEALNSDFAAYNVHANNGKILAFISHPFVPLEEATAALERINVHIADNPIISDWSVTRKALSASKISDFLSDSEYRETPLYRSVYGEWGFNYQLAIGFWDDVGHAHIFMCTRRETDFDELDRKRLNLLYPHFLKAIRCNELIGQRLNQLRIAAKLTPRESDALFWLSEGKTNPEMARILGISSRTVDKTLQNLYRKLGFTNRAAAMRYATCLNLGGFSQISF